MSNSGALPILGVGILIGAALVAVTTLPIQMRPTDPNGMQMTYGDLAAIMLSAVSVIVTVLGVVIAILALWGFKTFKETAERSANDHIDGKIGQITTNLEVKVMEHFLKEMEGGKIKTLMEARADYFLKYGAQLREKEENWEGDEEKEYGV